MADKDKKKNTTIEKLRQQTLVNASVLFDEIVYKSYLSELQNSEILPYQGGDMPFRWYQINKIVYEKDVFFTDNVPCCPTGV